MNVDGASQGTPGLSTCGGILCDFQGVFLRVFALYIGLSTAFRAELQATMKAIELATLHNWNDIWLETDSTLVLNAFQDQSVIPWDLRNHWDNCILMLRHFRFYTSHIYREGNVCADALAIHGLTISMYMWWNLIPSFLGSLVHANRVGRICYRFPPSMV